MADKTLNVLYQSSDEYAPFAGVSILSLLKNNCRDDILITIYYIDDGVSPKNRAKIQQIVEENHVRIVFLDMGFAVTLLENLNISTYRGSYSTYLKLFAINALPQDVKRILYIDSDTIIVGDISELIDYDMNGNIIGMVALNTLFVHLPQQIELSMEIPYFNAGLILFDTEKWKNENIQELLTTSLENTALVFHADQSLLNIALRRKIQPLPQKFNTPTPYSFLPLPILLKSTLQSKLYFLQELEEMKADTRIRHEYLFLSERPWHKNSIHPDAKLFDHYLAKSPWKDYQKQTASTGLVFRIGKFLYRVLPRSLFCYIYAWQANKENLKIDKRVVQKIQMCNIVDT
ncbi:lipopolysaccharide 1,2-glucosyltransferase [Spirochaetia bacterium]|nr:lipopolysaccharide 1,2-glucosyltransferase [Spirochaetia bacterium]